MKPFAITLLCALALPACNTLWAGNPTRTNDIGVGIQQPPAAPAPVAPVQASYACDGGVTLSVTFDNAAGKAILVRPGAAPVTLPQQVSGSGFRYSDGKSEFAGKGDDAMWTANGQTLSCKAKG